LAGPKDFVAAAIATLEGVKYDVVGLRWVVADADGFVIVRIGIEAEESLGRPFAAQNTAIRFISISVFRCRMRLDWRLVARVILIDRGQRLEDSRTREAGAWNLRTDL
jgi:hypothetical protein